MSKPLYFIGAAALEIISIAAIFALEHFQQKRNRNLEKLEQQLQELQKEIKKLRQPGNRKALKPEYNAETSTSEESDSEYYELTDCEDFPNTTSVKQPHNLTRPTLKELDKKLLTSKTSSIREALDQLIKLDEQFPKNLELLWRIAEAHQMLSIATKDKVIRREHIDKGIIACEAAFELDSESPQVHKWFTLLLGSRVQLQPLKEKIKDVVLFKKQLNKSLDLNPNDGILHYALGKFTYETANMTWYERKAASLIFDELPSGTYDEALKYCLKAEQLLKYEFRESKLTIAKCQIALGKYNDAVKSLKKAACFDGLDSTVNKEIAALLTKYSSYG